MKEFDMTSDGLMNQVAKIKGQDGVATRSDQAQLVLSVLNTLCTATAAYFDACGKGEDSDICLENIRAMMRGTCHVVDDDFSELLKMAADLSFHSTVASAVIYAGGRLSKSNSKYSKKTYFIKNKETGLVKIGRSIDPSGRVKALQCGSGVELDIILVIDSDIERELHLRFSDDRAFNEWFYHSKAIESYIQDKRLESQNNS